MYRNTLQNKCNIQCLVQKCAAWNTPMIFVQTPRQYHSDSTDVNLQVVTPAAEASRLVSRVIPASFLLFDFPHLATEHWCFRLFWFRCQPWSNHAVTLMVEVVVF